LKYLLFPAFLVAGIINSVIAKEEPVLKRPV